MPFALQVIKAYWDLKVFGGNYIKPKKWPQNLTPLIAGGTGSFSHLETMPTHMPDAF